MDLASVVAALASVGVRVSGSTPNSSVQVDSSRACPTGLAGPEPSGTINDPGQHFQDMPILPRDCRRLRQSSWPVSHLRFCHLQPNSWRSLMPDMVTAISCIITNITTNISTNIITSETRPGGQEQRSQWHGQQHCLAQKT